MSLINGDPVLNCMRLQQFAPWLGSVMQRSFAEEVHHHLNLTVRSIFLYRIKDGEVALLEKPGFSVRETFNDSSKPDPVSAAFIYREEFIRANMYRDFIARIMASSAPAADLLIAIDVNDAPIEAADAPVFAFQKPVGSNTVLFPDVDFLHGNFYIPAEFRDATPYADKMPRAVFAGSTTGGRTITAHDVETLAIPRLRSGVFFKDSAQVDFRIPRIVQCESADVEAMIARLGINAARCPWDEQFRYRFILSMDGNGATCSRVVIGLLSNAVLTKYESPHELYYFGALIPWRHYIPVASDEDVLRIVETECRHPMIFAGIAEEGRNFARRYLGRAGVCTYSSELLALYASCLSSASGSHSPPPTADVPGSAMPLVECGAHIQGIGDVWGWPGEWIGEIGSGRAVEAIAVVPTGVPQGAITVRVVLNDGSLSNVSEFGAFCGTRGRDLPIRGFELRLQEDSRDRYTCTYHGRFTDGTCVGPLASGEMCRSPSGAALESFHVSVAERAS